MRILVVGAYGLIGSYIVSRLSAAGHTVLGAGRDPAQGRRRFPEVEWIQADLRTMTGSAWDPVLHGVDAVVNCAGALQGGPRDDLHAVHVGAVETLVEACVRATVPRFVQISAAGVGEGRATDFNRTKLAAEGVVRASGLEWVILRPGLVLAPAAYGGSALLRGLAAMPFAIPAVHADSVVQIVSADDLAEAVARCIDGSSPARVSVDLVHHEPVRLAVLLAELRRWLGLPEAPVVRLPALLARGTAHIADALAWAGWRSPMRTTAIEQLRMGIVGDATAAERVLGLELRSLRETLREMPAGVQERWFARLYFLKPLVLATLAGFWLASGVVGLTAGRTEAVEILTAAGMPERPATAAVIGGSALDMALALGLCFRHWAGLVLGGMFLVSLAYLLGGTLLRPDLWADPLGPLLKTIPATALLLVAMALLDER